MNWQDFLDRWQAALLVKPRVSEDVLADARESRWQVCTGATEEELLRAEERLGLALPPSYRAFFRASNGWRPFEPFLPRLFSVHDVTWYTPFDPTRQTSGDRGAEDLTGMLSLDDQDCCSDPGISAADWALDLELALLVSDPTSSEDVVVLLHPNRRDASGEWEASFFVLWCGRGDRYRSFHELMLAQHARFHMYATVGRTFEAEDPPD
jgi:hypothetical protein